MRLIDADVLKAHYAWWGMTELCAAEVDLSAQGDSHLPKQNKGARIRLCCVKRRMACSTVAPQYPGKHGGVRSRYGISRTAPVKLRQPPLY